MSNAFALDLKVARRKSGLTQSDCAHLLGSHRSKFSHLELGKQPPTAVDIAMLSLIYGRTYDTLCRAVFEDAARELGERLVTLPMPRRNWLGHFNRANSLDNLSARIQALTAVRI